MCPYVSCIECCIRHSNGVCAGPDLVSGSGIINNILVHRRYEVCTCKRRPCWNINNRYDCYCKCIQCKLQRKYVIAVMYYSNRHFCYSSAHDIPWVCFDQYQAIIRCAGSSCCQRRKHTNHYLHIHASDCHEQICCCWNMYTLFLK